MAIYLDGSLLNRSSERPNLLLHQTAFHVNATDCHPELSQRVEGFATHACHHAARRVAFSDTASLFTFHFAKRNDPERAKRVEWVRCITSAPFDKLRIILLRKISIVSVVLSLRFVFGIKE